MGRIDSMPLSTRTFDTLILEPSPRHSRLADAYSAGRWLSQQWKETIHETVSDLRSARLIRCVVYFLYPCWIAFLFFSISMLGISSYGTSTQPSLGTACQPDGSFSPYVNNYSAWDSSGFFEITLAFGPLSFTAAKIIDICWDVVIGRVGQAALAMISWNIFSQYTATTMDLSPVTYRTFWVVFLYQEPTFFSIGYLLRDFLSYRRLKSIIAMVFMILTLIFLLVFPTLASAMTGYTPVNKAFVRGNNDNLTPFSEFQVVTYIIHDGFRVNLTGNTYVTRVFELNQLDPVIWKGSDELEYYGCYKEKCELLNTVSKYVSSYGFYGSNYTESTWQNTTLPAPVLNISASYIPPGPLFSHDWTDPQTKQKPFNDITKSTYFLSNQTYPMDYIMDRGGCQPVLNEYRWGFSFIQLFILSSLMLVWTTGISIMWLQAHLKLPLRGHPEVPTGWRALLLLAEAIRKELTEAGINPASLKDEQVKDEIRKHLQGGSISFNASLARRDSKFTSEFRNWLRRFDLLGRMGSHKWWWLGLFVTAIVASLSGTMAPTAAPWLVMLSGGAGLGILLALIIGSTTRSRLFMTTFWVLVALVVIIAIYASGTQL